MKSGGLWAEKRKMWNFHHFKSGLKSNLDRVLTRSDLKAEECFRDNVMLFSNWTQHHFKHHSLKPERCLTNFTSPSSASLADEFCSRSKYLTSHQFQNHFTHLKVSNHLLSETVLCFHFRGTEVVTTKLCVSWNASRMSELLMACERRRCCFMEARRCVWVHWEMTKMILVGFGYHLCVHVCVYVRVWWEKRKRFCVTTGNKGGLEDTDTVCVCLCMKMHRRFHCSFFSHSLAHMHAHTHTHTLGLSFVSTVHRHSEPTTT